MGAICSSKEMKNDCNKLGPVTFGFNEAHATSFKGHRVHCHGAVMIW